MARISRQRTIRIIGGEWRSRKIAFGTDEAIRPTPDRIRETLFNWLQYSIPDAACLELFAGSGILSIEALSRGAKRVMVIDQSAEAIRQISANLNLLDADCKRFKCVESDALNWITRNDTRQWDIVFLDPPFTGNELVRVLRQIPGILNKEGFVYIESPGAIELDESSGLRIYRQKRAAGVHYCLCQHI